MKSINRLNKKIIIVLGIISSAFLFFIVILAFKLSSDKVHNGILIGKTNVSGLTKEQAAQKVKNDLIDSDSMYLTLEYSGKKWQVPYNQINARYNVDEAVNKAYSVGRTGNVFKRAADVIKAQLGIDFDIVFSYDKQFLLNNLNTIKREIDIPKRNARIAPGQGGGVIIPQVPGKVLDIDRAVQLADEHITKLSSSEIRLPIIEDKPSILENDLKGMTDELGSYYTTFNVGDSQRAHNIKLACSRIDGIILKPQDVFSMDKVLKSRTTGNGYKLAKAYFQNEVVEEIGGGVCQVTTTLYDAVLTANLDVIERKQHTMMVDYVGPGLDATVSDKGVDFKFKNSYTSPIYLYSVVDNNKIVMKVFGKNQDPTQKVQLESEVTEIFYPGPAEVIVDAGLPKGTRKVELKPKNGYRANLYKVIYKGGIPVSRELVSENLYQPLRGKVRIGA